MYKLKLYITGQSAKSVKAIEGIKMILADKFNERYSLEIIDVLENTQAAEDEKIFATPTLIKVVPPPTMRIIGDFSNSEKVLLGLNLVAQG